jgi:hypothetical protein
LYLEEAELLVGQQPQTPDVGQLLVLLDRIDDQRRNGALELAAAKPAFWAGSVPAPGTQHAQNRAGRVGARRVR